MAKRGPKTKPSKLKVVGGTERKDRETSHVYGELQGEILLPDDYADLKDEKPRLAKKVLRTWNRKLEIYAQRSQSVVGFEGVLYQYCLLEVSINEMYNMGAPVSTAMVSQYRVYATEFYDTPASQVISGPGPKGNPFANNGKPRKA